MSPILPIALTVFGLSLFAFSSAKAKTSVPPELAKSDVEQNAPGLKQQYEDAKAGKLSLDEMLQLASDLGAAGATTAAQEIQELASDMAKAQQPDTITEANIQQVVATALATNDPAQIRATAKKCAAAGFLTQAAQLYNAADEIEAQNTGYVTSPGIMPPGIPPEIVAEPEAAPPPPQTPAHAAAYELSHHLNLLNRRVGSVRKAKGIEDVALVKRFQTLAGITADGKYGPGSAKSLAHYYGDVPIVYYWPRGTLPGTAVPRYREELLAIAATKPADHARMLEISAAREKGQGFGTSIPVTTTEDPAIQSGESTLQQYYQDLQTAGEGLAQTGLTAIEDIMNRYS